MPISASDVLLVIDIQNDFLTGGALAVPDGEAIVPLVNRLIRAFPQVVVTQDWHPEGHVSFASSHDGAKPFDVVQFPHGDQALAGPLRARRAGRGAARGARRRFGVPDLRKGVNAKIDSYSAFTEADGKTTTGLAALLKARGARRVFACGLATDYCVAYSALDARAAGFETFVVDDACRAIDAGGSLEAAWAKMNSAQVWRIQAREILGRAAAADMEAARAGRANLRYHLLYLGRLIGARNRLAGERLSYADLAAAARLSCVDNLGDAPWGESETAKA